MTTGKTIALTRRTFVGKVNMLSRLVTAFLPRSKHLLIQDMGRSGKKILLIATSVQSLSHVRLFATPLIAASQASLSITNSQSSIRLIHRVSDAIQPSHPLSPHLLLPSIFPSIRVFSNESVVCIRWPKYWSFSLSTCLPVNI